MLEISLDKVYDRPPNINQLEKRPLQYHSNNSALTYKNSILQANANQN